VLPEPDASSVVAPSLKFSSTLFTNPHGRLRAGWRLLAFALITGVAWFTLATGAGAAAFALHLRLPAGRYHEAWAQAFGAWSLAAALLVAHWVLLRFVEHRPWAFVRLGSFEARPRALATGAALGTLAIGVPSLVLLGVHWLAVRPPVTEAAWPRFLLVTLLIFPPAALLEELMFRGYAFAVLRESWGWRWTLVVTSIIFGLLHLGNPGVTPLAIVSVTLAGAWLAGVLLVTESLYAAWMAHFAWNWVMSALLHTEVSGLQLPVPGYRVVDAGPDWLTGGAWGPEGGVLAIAGMAAVMAVLLRRRLGRKEAVA
jgi:membrane protease YdiL (CAAX protease family)